MANGIKTNSSIVHLDISSNDITFRGGNVIFDTLMTNNSIISLDISSKDGVNRNRLTSEGIKKLETLLKKNQYIEFINLNGNTIKNEGLKYILLGLNNNSSLHHLSIANNEIDSNGIKLFKSLSKLK